MKLNISTLKRFRYRFLCFFRGDSYGFRHLWRANHPLRAELVIWMSDHAVLTKARPIQLSPLPMKLAKQKTSKAAIELSQIQHGQPPSMSCAGSRDRLLTDSAGSHEDPTSRARQHQLWVQYILYARFAVKTTLYSDYANYLLVVVPFALISGALGWNEAVVFILNFVAMFPLAALLSYSTEQLSASVGQIVGGLLNATFGNAVEMIVSRLYIVSRGL